MHTNNNQEKMAGTRQKHTKQKRNSYATIIRGRFVRDLALLDAALSVWDARQRLTGRLS